MDPHAQALLTDHQTYTALWIGWIAYFFIVEGEALFTGGDKSIDTLSAHIFDWFSMKGYSKLWRLRRFTLLATLAWIAAHLLSGGFF